MDFFLQIIWIKDSFILKHGIEFDKRSEAVSMQYRLQECFRLQE